MSEFLKNKLTEANKMLGERKFLECYEALSYLDKKFPNQKSILSLLCLLYSAIGNQKAALKLGQVVLSSHPKDPQVALNVFNFALLGYDYKTADETLSLITDRFRADDHFKKNSLKQLNHVKRYHKDYLYIEKIEQKIYSGKFKEALGALRHVPNYGIAEFSQRHQFYYYYCQFKLGVLANKANLKDRNEEKNFCLGLLFNFTKKSPDFSKSKVLEFLEETPTPHFYWNLIASYFLYLRELALAKKFSRLSILAERSVGSSYEILGAVLQKSSNIDGAINAFETSHEVLAWQNLNVWTNSLKLYLTKNRMADAYKVSVKALEQYPDNLELLAIQSKCLSGLGLSVSAKDIYQKILQIQPKDQNAIINIAVIEISEGNLDEAEKFLQDSIEINPTVEAYINLAVVHERRKNFKEMLLSIKKAHDIKPNSKTAYNLALAYERNYRFDKAFASLLPLLNTDQDNRRYWGALRFLIPGLCMQKGISSSELNNIEKLIHEKFRISPFYEAAISCYLPFNSSDEEKNEKNCELGIKTFFSTHGFSKSYNKEILPVYALLHSGRSGTGLLHSLVDNHPEIATLPSVYFSELFNPQVWKKIFSSNKNELIQNFITMYPMVINANSYKAIPISSEDKSGLPKAEGLLNLGDNQNEQYSINLEVFSRDVSSLLNNFTVISPALFLDTVSKAVSIQTTSDQNFKANFYHVHNPQNITSRAINVILPGVKFLMLIRDPIQSLESWIEKPFMDGDIGVVSARIFTFIEGLFSNRNGNIFALRLEDLKLEPEKTLKALCSFMGVEYRNSLLETTVQGKRWWGDPSSPHFTSEGMDPFDMRPILRPVGNVFSERDQFILGTLFEPLRYRFGYRKSMGKNWSKNLKKVEIMLEAEPLDCLCVTDRNSLEISRWCYLKVFISKTIEYLKSEPDYLRFPNRIY